MKHCKDVAEAIITLYEMGCPICFRPLLIGSGVKKIHLTRKLLSKEILTIKLNPNGSYLVSFKKQEAP